MERDVLEVYPSRKLECSEADLEMAICILEGVLQKPEQIGRKSRERRTGHEKERASEEIL